jgi:hypothetical protein
MTGGTARYKARQLARCQRAYARGRAAATRGEPETAYTSYYGCTNPASVAWIAEPSQSSGSSRGA